MKLRELLTEKKVPDREKDHVCKTPGTMFHTHLAGNTITIAIDFPEGISTPSSKEEAEQLEWDLHLALENVLKRLF